MSDTLNYDDPYAGTSETIDGPVFNVTGGDWDTIQPSGVDGDRIVINMGPQHPSTHGVLRLILELDGEQVHDARAGIGYLHTGIEKNMEFRTWNLRCHLLYTDGLCCPVLD